MITLRGTDVHGSGAFRATRRKGSRVYEHEGIDPVCVQGEAVCAFEGGVVTKVGLPYYDADNTERNHYRYIEIAVPNGDRHRYMYTHPLVDAGQHVETGDILGGSQDLTKVFEGITQHYHFEIRRGDGVIDPVPYLEELGYEFNRPISST